MWYSEGNSYVRNFIGTNTGFTYSGKAKRVCINNRYVSYPGIYSGIYEMEIKNITQNIVFHCRGKTILHFSKELLPIEILVSIVSNIKI